MNRIGISVFYWSVPFGLPPSKPPAPPEHWTTQREHDRQLRQLQSIADFNKPSRATATEGRERSSLDASGT